VSSPASTRVVVAGMSAREAAAHDLLARLAEPHAGVVAHVQQGSPTLASVLGRLADDGAGRVVVAGVSLGTLAPGVSWLRRVAAHWWRERRDAGLPLPELEVGLVLVSDAVELATVVDGLTKQVRGGEPGLTSAAWEEVPRHRHQVLVCRGPRCTARGSDRTAEALALALSEEGLGDDDVLLTQTGCLFPCNHAPVVAVQPDDTWYGRLTPDAARRLAREHLVGGRSLDDHRLTRHRRDP